MCLRESDVYCINRYFFHTRSQFPGNTDRKNYFIAACYHIDSIVDSEFINIDCIHGGIIGIGNSRLDLFLKWSKIMRLHAILHDASGYMKNSHNLGPGYIYVLPCETNSCFLGHLTGVAFFLYLKLF